MYDKISIILSNIALANFFLLINSIWQIVGRAFLIIGNLSNEVSLDKWDICISHDKKKISKTILMLISAHKNAG